jgi:hypothetical protein
MVFFLRLQIYNNSNIITTVSESRYKFYTRTLSFQIRKIHSINFGNSPDFISLIEKRTKIKKKKQ